MSKEPELGQLAFGNPTGDYGTEPWQDALIDFLLEEIGRVYWNVNQKTWEVDDLKMKGFQVRSYCWDSESKEAKKSNLEFDFSPQQIFWYKNPGRSQSCSRKFTNEQWIRWFNHALKVIQANDAKLY